MKRRLTVTVEVDVADAGDNPRGLIREPTFLQLAEVLRLAIATAATVDFRALGSRVVRVELPSLIEGGKSLSSEWLR